MGINRVGNNHHVSTYKYIHVYNDETYFIKRAFLFVKNKETSVAVYARIRVGLCEASSKINSYITSGLYNDNIDSIKRLKRVSKSLSKAISTIDTYFQLLVNRGEGK